MVQKTSFIQKLYSILLDPSCQSYICWGASGASFVILDVHGFSSNILPKVFKHANFPSFVRQLNLYGFHKLNRTYHRHQSSSDSTSEKDTEPREFYHPKFIKGRLDLLPCIKRKSSSTFISSHPPLVARTDSCSTSESCSESLPVVQDTHLVDSDTPHILELENQQLKSQLATLEITLQELCKRVTSLEQWKLLHTNSCPLASDALAFKPKVDSTMNDFSIERLSGKVILDRPSVEPSTPAIARAWQ